MRMHSTVGIRGSGVIAKINSRQIKDGGQPQICNVRIATYEQ